MVTNIEEYLKEHGNSLPANAYFPISVDYCPQIDVSNELGPLEYAFYQSLLGIICYTVQVRRFSINVEAYLMGLCMAIPSHVNLFQIFHVFVYLKNKHNLEMVFDPSDPDIDEGLFQKQDQKDTIYGEIH